jgi:hypothetical protein
MTVFDDHGNLVEAPITESVQIRVYRAITMASPTPDITSLTALAERSGQDFYEIRLSRPQLFANKSGGLRATAPDEMEFSTFQQQGDDIFEWRVMNRSRLASSVSALQECPVCHSAGGINSLNSRRMLLKPNELQHDRPGGYGPGPYWWASDETKDWKHDRYDWGLLNGYWRSGNGLR